MANCELYIGLMSGTSADGVDLALVDFASGKPELVATSFTPFDQTISQRIQQLYLPTNNEIDQAFSLSKELASYFANAVNSFLSLQQLITADIIAIGNHGQTIRHRPASTEQTFPFTLQIGCNQTLACLTGIKVIGDFRQKDITLGGQGAPLVPPFHRMLLTNQSDDSFVVNIGGIANITFLPKEKDKPIIGFDTGPGNCLLDSWFQRHHSDKAMDENGLWASSGNVIEPLLQSMLDDAYFSQSLPKSTGREVFNLSWLTSYSENSSAAAQDIQATLSALTAKTIANDIIKLSDSGKVYVCGGGVHNKLLMTQLQSYLAKFSVLNIDSLGIDGDSLEAMAFAWLAYAYTHQQPSNLPSVTGASKATTLGALFLP